jgi:hypothetical protein
MAGLPTTWYEVKHDMDWLPDFVDPEQTIPLPRQVRGRLVSWLEQRIAQRY